MQSNPIKQSIQNQVKFKQNLFVLTVLTVVLQVPRQSSNSNFRPTKPMEALQGHTSREGKDDSKHLPHFLLHHLNERRPGATHFFLSSPRLDHGCPHRRQLQGPTRIASHHPPHLLDLHHSNLRALVHPLRSENNRNPHRHNLLAAHWGWHLRCLGGYGWCRVHGGKAKGAGATSWDAWCNARGSVPTDEHPLAGLPAIIIWHQRDVYQYRAARILLRRGTKGIEIGLYYICSVVHGNWLLP